MKTIQLYLFIISSIVLLASCNDDNSNLETTDISGEYIITSIQSSIPVDMNNDGIKSKDVLEEVTTPYRINQSTSGPIYYKSTATVGYNKEKNKGSVLFPYPFQHIVNDSNNSATLAFYVMQFPGFSYTLNSKDEIEIIDIYKEYQLADYGVVSSAKRIDKDSFLVTVSVKIFDFKEKKWINTDVEIECLRNNGISF